MSSSDVPKFNMGDRVRKTRGSEWQGRVVGTYSTTLTPEGYAVESEAHPGSVQIYPASALEAVVDSSGPLWDGWIKFDRERKEGRWR